MQVLLSAALLDLHYMMNFCFLLYVVIDNFLIDGLWERSQFEIGSLLIIYKTMNTSTPIYILTEKSKNLKWSILSIFYGRKKI